MQGLGLNTSSVPPFPELAPRPVLMYGVWLYLLLPLPLVPIHLIPIIIGGSRSCRSSIYHQSHSWGEGGANSNFCDIDFSVKRSGKNNWRGRKLSRSNPPIWESSAYATRRHLLSSTRKMTTRKADYTNRRESNKKNCCEMYFHEGSPKCEGKKNPVYTKTKPRGLNPSHLMGHATANMTLEVYAMV